MNSTIQSMKTSLYRRAAVAALGIAILGIAAARPAAAQTSSVTAQTSVMGVPGGYTSYAGPATANTPINANATAGGLYNNGYGTVRGWSIGSAASGPDGISVYAYASAEKITATAFNSNPSTQPVVKYKDALKITSSTLPYGTPVKLVIDPNIAMSVSGQGGYSGNVQAVLSAGGKVSSNQYSYYYGTVTQRRDGAITLDTKVGYTVYIDLSIIANAGAFYLLQGFGYNGVATTDASANLKVTVQTLGVGYTSASGRVY